MRFALLIVEPPRQRAGRSEAEGREACARMQRFGEALRERGQLVAVQSLASQARAVRVSQRGARVVDGPFAEAKEMVGGFFLVDCAGWDEALALAKACPAAEWATVEVRPAAACYEDGPGSGQGLSRAGSCRFRAAGSSSWRGAAAPRPIHPAKGDTSMDPVVHFEMPYRDRDRAARFYAEAFGWQMEKLGPEMGDYVLATTATADVRPGAPAGAINGGLFPLRADVPAQHPGVVIGVDDVRAAMARIAAAGGQVLGEPMAIPGVGDYVAFTDTEGNRHSVLQPLPMAAR